MIKALDSFLRLALIAVLAFSVYTISQRHEHSFDVQDSIDLLVDSGLKLSHSELEKDLLALRKILVTTDVNAALSSAVIGQLLLLNAADSTAPIDLYLRTQGGWEADAFAIIDTIQSISASVSIHALGEVHSSGSMILAAATGERIVYPNTILGYHALEPNEDALWKERYIAFWRENANIPDSWIEREDGEMIYFDAAEAITYKVADALINK